MLAARKFVRGRSVPEVSPSPPIECQRPDPLFQRLGALMRWERVSGMTTGRLTSIALQSNRKASCSRWSWEQLFVA